MAVCAAENCTNTHDNKKYCSVECHKAVKRSGGEMKTCAGPSCDETFWVKPHLIKKQNNHFCGQPCKAEWQSENVFGENHPCYNRETVKCDYCGDSLEVRQNRAAQDHQFCGDKDCHANWLSENRSGENSHLWKGGQVELECSWRECSNTVHRCPAEAKANDNQFCSEECRGNWLSENMRGDNNPNYNREEIECSRDGCDNTRLVIPYYIKSNGNYCSRSCSDKDRSNQVEITCDWCGQTEVRPESQEKKHDKSFCSKNCLWKYVSENYSKEDHWNWKGGTINYYGRNWSKMRRRTRERHGYSCARCGKSKKEIGRNPDVHHIKPIRSFERMEDANTAENLVCLCRSCHRIIESLPVRPQFSSTQSTSG